MDGNPVPVTVPRHYGADEYDDEEEDEAAQDQTENALKYDDFKNIIEATEGQTNN